MQSPIEKILVYVDGSQESVTAAQYGICLSRACGAQLVALYVVNTQALNRLLKARIFIAEEEEEYSRELAADGDRYLNHVRDLAREKGVLIDVVSASGSIQKEIKKCIKEQKIDLLLIGELSQLRSRRDEFYSETEMAMRRAPCSVTIVKDEERVWELYDALD
ncbi:MAG: universal stress protein [Planctomycetota bacterium]|jgi:nucleotide-binding universal stress UspA family protein